MEIPITNKTAISGMTALSLLAYLTTPQVGTITRRAQDRFYQIFYEEIFTFCTITCRNNFGHTKDWFEVAREIHSDAFRIALEKVSAFKLPEGCTEQQAYNTIRKWISKIANFLILKHIRSAAKEQENFDMYKEYVEMGLENSATGFRNVEKNYDEAKFNQVWSGLSPFAKEIVLLSYDHDCFPRQGEKNKKHLPQPVLDRLYTKYMTDNDNYRQTKTRAFKKILSCLKT